jgi:hypothetical protein
MSSRVSAAISLDLPRRTWSECAAAALCVLCAVVVEAVVARYPLAPAGSGLVLGSALAAWLCLARLRATHAIRKVAWLADDTWWLGFGDGRIVAARLGGGTRILGRTLVLEWVTAERSSTQWLTPWDVERRQLRRLRARIACAASLRAH